MTEQDVRHRIAARLFTRIAAKAEARGQDEHRRRLLDPPRDPPGAKARRAAALLRARAADDPSLARIQQIADRTTMVGMLLAGAPPIDAVRLQLVLLYVLLAAVALATMLAVLLSRRAFFTAQHQLREIASPQAHQGS